MMRMVVLMVMLALALAGCTQTVLKNPATGATATCTAGPLHDINLWSKYPACVETYISEGYHSEP